MARDRERDDVLEAAFPTRAAKCLFQAEASLDNSGLEAEEVCAGSSGDPGGACPVSPLSCIFAESASRQRTLKHHLGAGTCFLYVSCSGSSLTPVNPPFPCLDRFYSSHPIYSKENTEAINSSEEQHLHSFHSQLSCTSTSGPFFKNCSSASLMRMLEAISAQELLAHCK